MYTAGCEMNAEKDIHDGVKIVVGSDEWGYVEAYV